MNSSNISAQHPTEPISTSNNVLPESYPGCASVPQPREPKKYMRLPRVKERTGLGKTTIYKMQSRGEFPMSRELTPGAVGWLEEEIEAWCTRRDQASRPVAERRRRGPSRL